jgi:ubiquinone/menaquinone biosynthesis C-methylase UbiE
LNDRVTYRVKDARELPFEDNTFDAVFTNASLHAWEAPESTLNEIHRVLKSGGHYYISDLRRDMNPVAKLLLKMQTKKKDLRAGLIASINAAYTEEEIKNILLRTKLSDFEISKNPFSLIVKGIKK